MIVSSRTPEGEPNHCPLCNKQIVLEPSLPWGDAPCPNCGRLLWFFKTQGETHLFEPKSAETVQTWLARGVARLFGFPQGQIERKLAADENLDFVNELALDSIDIVELVTELSEQTDASE